MSSTADAVFIRVAALGETGQLAVSINRAAEITDFSRAFIRDAVNKQHMPAYRVGEKSVRILVSDLQEWLTRVRLHSLDDR